MDLQKEVTVWIGGEAGEGIASAGDVWMKTLARLGLGAFAHNSYQSVIRGGDVLLQIRAGPFPVLSQGGDWDFLLALNQNVLDLHLRSAGPKGRALFNSDAVKSPAVPAWLQLRSAGRRTDRGSSKNPMMQNTVLLGTLTYFEAAWDVFEGSSAPNSESAKRNSPT